MSGLVSTTCHAGTITTVHTLHPHLGLVGHFIADLVWDGHTHVIADIVTLHIYVHVIASLASGHSWHVRHALAQLLCFLDILHISCRQKCAGQCRMVVSVDSMAWNDVYSSTVLLVSL